MTGQGQLFSPARRWRVGQEFEVDGIEFWVEEGSHPINGGDREIDLRLCHRDSHGRARRTLMALGFVFPDFFAENESAKNGLVVGRQGGAYYLAGCRYAAQAGWSEAAQWVMDERRRARAK